MKKRFWISFDLGIAGDFEGIYEWLDAHEAVECGENCASIVFETKADPFKEIAAALKKAVQFRKKDRVYLIGRKPDGKQYGAFIIGRRRRSPWSGYAVTLESSDDTES